MKRMTVLSFVSGLFFVCLAIAGDEGNQKEKSKKLTKPETELVNRVFSSRLLEIAAEYKEYQRMDQKIRWSPMLCAAPPRLPKNLAALSASDSKETHGRKLYFLYARKPWQYQSNVWGVTRKSELPIRAPLGQVLVKEAWNPVKVELNDQPNPSANDANKPKKANQPRRAYAKDGKDTYHAGDKRGLFVMFKTKEDTPGTDRGWVYGTVSADGKRVTSVGLVKNCMQCHQDAPHDRQIGFVTKRKN